MFSTISTPQYDCKNCMQVTKFLQKICFKEDDAQVLQPTLTNKKTIFEGR